MKLPVTVAVCALSASIAIPTQALAEFEAGEAEYTVSCAACHGEAADGNGPIASMFAGAVPNLTQIAARNDGAFPTLEVFQVIDGRTQIKGHGDPMPLFGNRYKAESLEIAGPYGAERLARARLLELVLYLQSIQQ